MSDEPGAPDRVEGKFESLLEAAPDVSSVETQDGLLVTAPVRDLTERKRADEELHRMAAVLEYSNDAILSRNLDGIITTWNPAAERLYGYTADEAIGRPVSFLVPPGHVDDAETLAARVSRRERVEHYETLRICKDGRVIDVSISVAPILDSRGDIVGMTAIARDITERKRIEEASLAAAGQFRSAFENAPAGMAVIALDGRLLQVNRRLCELLDRSEPELLRSSLDAVTLPADRAAMRRALKDLLVGDPRSAPEERRFLTSDGRQVWALVGVSLLLGPDGPVHFIAQFVDITATKDAERALEASQTRYRTLLDLLPGTAVLVLDADLRVFSASGTTFPGPATNAALEGRPLDEVTAAEDYAALVPFFRSALAGQPTGWFPVTSVTGTHWLVDATAIPGQQGQPLLLVTMRDATELMRAQHALRSAEGRFHGTFDDAPVGVVITDLRGRWLQINAAFARIAGYTQQQLLQMNAADLLSPDDLRLRSEVARQVRRNGAPRAAQGRIRHADGHLVWVNAIAAPLYDEAGEQIAYITHVEDITEHKRVEDDLRSAEQRYRTAFERAPVGMAQIAVDGRLVEVNDSLADLLGRTAGELIGRTDGELTHPDDAARTADAITRLVAGELTSFRVEQRYRHAGGQPIWVALSIAAVTDSHGEVRHLLAHYLDITERKRFEAELAHLADHDPLTGLLNRRGFEAELDRQAAKVNRYGPSGGLAIIDLDHFKQVNDELGHQAGDELIISIADLLRRTVRGTDTVARLGGDEFAVILPQAQRADAKAVAEKIVRAVRDQVTVLSGARRRTITASAGVAMFDDPSLSGEAVLLNADLTMYEAKNAGRNRYAVYNDTSARQPPPKARLDWVERINVALEEDRFRLHAQPVLDLHTGHVSRYELLLRMLDDNGLPIRPDAFLHTAERFGLIRRIDRWVTGQAVDLLAHPDLPANTVLEVNISGLSVGDVDLVAFLEERFAETGADPSRLVLEITETAAVGNLQAARTFSERLTSIGCKFALDDFGSGFGSFYYLKHLLFDYIKIDGEFIANCVSSETDQLVIQALVTIAHGLNKQTVAEFVGDEDTLRFVTNQGVDFAQGYYIGEPDIVDGLLGGHGRGAWAQRARG